MQEIPEPSPIASEGSPPRAGARARNRRRTYDDIYTAAMALFQERTFEDVTVDDICAAADVGKATFFRHFGSKFGLVDEFNQRIAAKIDDAIDLTTFKVVASLPLAPQPTGVAVWQGH